MKKKVKEIIEGYDWLFITCFVSWTCLMIRDIKDFIKK